MADPVDLNRLMPDAREFLSELAENNDRGWFQANKARYDSALKRPAEKLLAQIAHWLHHEHDQPPRTKLFRPHRDVRFSEDKTPFHTHLHMMWSLPDGRAWMLGIAPEYATAGAGVMRFEPEQLDRWREALDSHAGAELETHLEREDWRVDPPALKRVPPPYAADHPREHLLRHKGLVAWRDGLDSGLSEDPDGTLRRVFSGFSPLMEWLGDIT